MHVALRDTLWHDQDDRLGLVHVGQAPDDREHPDRDDDEWQDNPPFSTPDNPADFLRCVLLPRQHGYLFTTGSHNVIPTRALLRSSDPGIPAGRTTAAPAP